VTGLPDDDLEELTDVVLLASRALIAVASRSIAAIDDAVTLPQFRALVVLDGNGGTCRVGELGNELRIKPSTATRLCDRLVARRLVRRAVDPTNRREVTITLTAAGRRLVADVTARRRREIAAIVARVPPAQRATIVEGLAAFRDAAGGELAGPTVPW
jgi:DNA-binding MarR family transcriptional regulator